MEFDTVEDRAITQYFETFYQQMASPPDFSLVKEYFEKQDDVETVARLDEIKSAQVYIRTNYLAIVRSIQDQQQIKSLILVCRDAGAIAEHGRNLFGLEPVDSVCKGHRKGEYWVHCAFAGELKCLSGFATVFDHATGRRRTIHDLYETQDIPVLTSLLNEGREELKFIPARASHIIQNGVRPTFDLRLESGRRTAATSNHEFLTLEGWKDLGDISSGEWVAVPRQTRASEPSRRFSDEEVKAIGYLLGDGSVSGYISFTASNDAIRQDFIDCLLTMGYLEGVADFRNPTFHRTDPIDRAPGVRVSHSRGDRNHHQSSPLRIILENLKVWGRIASTKEIPDEFFGLSEYQTALLLGALWSTDGSIHVGDHERNGRESDSRRNDVKYYSISESLCLGVQGLLLRLGIRSTVTTGHFEWNGEPKEVFITRVVGSESKRKFANRVRVVGKDHRLDWINERLPNGDDTPYPAELIPNGESAVIGTGKRRYKSQIHQTVTEDVLRHFSHLSGVQRALDADVLWERVASITLRGEEMTYDLEVPEHHSFVVDDIVCHNTTLALNYAYNNVMVYGKNIFYAILEMPYTQLRRNLYVIHSSHGKFVTRWHGEDGYVGLDYRQVRDGELDARDKKRFRIVARDFEKSARGKLFVWRPAEDVTIDDIRRKAEMFHNKWGCDGIVIDHLGLVVPVRRTNDYVVSLNSVVRDGRLMALNFARGSAVPVLALFQLNRQGKLRADKNDGRYDFAAISYANEIEKSADVVTYTYLNDELRRAGKFYLGCLKNRDNPIFRRMVGKILWETKRIRALETGLIDFDTDQLVRAASKISAELGLDMASMIA